MEFQLISFKSWKMMLWKCYTQYASKFGKLSSGHRTGKGQFSFQSQERQCQRMLKLSQNCTYLTLKKQCWKVSKPGFNNTWTMNFQIQAGFRKGRGTRDQIANICWIIEKSRELPKNIYFYFIDYAKAFGCMDHNKL